MKIVTLHFISGMVWTGPMEQVVLDYNSHPSPWPDYDLLIGNRVPTTITATVHEPGMTIEGEIKSGTLRNGDYVKEVFYDSHYNSVE